MWRCDGVVVWLVVRSDPDGAGGARGDVDVDPVPQPVHPVRVHDELAALRAQRGLALRTE